MLKFELFDDMNIMIDERFVKVPLGCPVCKLLLMDSDDHDSFYNFECCSACKMQWAWPNKDKWLVGWRPSAEMVIEFRQNRVSVPSYTVRG